MTKSFAAIFAAGRAFAAAQPQTEFTTSKTVPSCWSNTWDTSSGVVKPSNPKSVNSADIGATKCGGYIFFTVRKQEWEASPYRQIINDLEESQAWQKLEHITKEYNVKEGVSCQLCLYQVN